MATFDQLSAEQRAIIELVLKQGQSYDQLGEMLGMPTSRVRELARDALVRLSPVSAAAVDDDWRGQLGDYLLNQQSGPESTATQGPPAPLRGRPRLGPLGARLARAVLRRDGNIPQIPEGEAAPSPASGVASASPRSRKEPRTREPQGAASRARPVTGRGGGGAPAPAPGVGALAAVLLFAVLRVARQVLLFNDDDEPASANRDNAASARGSSASWCCARRATRAATPRASP